jgi:pimeloyl-ACP methyl ester carboxylesterase
MKRSEIVCASVGALLLLVSAWTIRRAELPRETFTLDSAGCSMPITVIEPPQPTRASAILFHGLAANRRVMQLLGENLARENGLRAYLVDLPGHGDNTDRFSFARAQKCAAATVEALIRDQKVDPKQTVLVGHSMGAAIAIELADSEPTAATIAISPAPLVLPRRMPANLLVFSAQYDLSALRQQAQGLAEAAGGDRTTTEDFLQLRAFHLQILSLADHTSVLVDPRVTEQAANWIQDSFCAATLGVNPKALQILECSWHPVYVDRFITLSSLVDSYAKIAPFVGFAALLLMFPAALALATRPLPPPEREIIAAHPTRALALAEGAALALVSIFLLAFGVPLKALLAYSGEGLIFVLVVVAAFMLALDREARQKSWRWNPFPFIAIAILGFVAMLEIGGWLDWRVPLEFLHMYSADYLVSLLAIFAVLLLTMNRAAAKESWSFNPRQWLAAAILGFAVILAIGAWLNWRVSGLWLNEARWLRFAAVMPFAFLFAFAEETILGPVQEGKQRAIRYAISLLLRLELWLACILAYYTLTNGQFLIALLVTALAAFSILQRLGTDALRRRTGSPSAAALFNAILAAWFIAAVFPLA